MCTLTTHRDGAGILATMNRDETLMRGPELPPVIERVDSATAWMAPRDSDKGGTWMGANSHGVIACLLNAYLPGESLMPDTTGQYRTRGEIIPNILAKGHASDALSYVLEDLDPEAYPSFMLLVATPQSVKRFNWYRRGKMEIEDLVDPWVIRSSSGWDSAEVTAWREKKFAEWIDSGSPSVGTLPAFHLIQEEGREDFSPLMQRDWSATRSITQVHVDYDACKVEMRYWPEPNADSQDAAACETLDLVPSSEQPLGAETS